MSKRVEDAALLATTQDCVAEADAFQTACSTAKAIVARSFDVMEAMFRQGTILAPFHAQVRGGGRIVEENEWDRGRTAAESQLHGTYVDKIVYCALSLDGKGAEGWGDYSMSLKENLIKDRASLFEENPFLFWTRHGVSAGQKVPPGYRGGWSDRGRLSIAKLQPKIKKGMKAEEFPQVLLNQGTGRQDADFVEVHVYGTIHPATIERVIGPVPEQRDDQILWTRCKRRIKEKGIAVEETP